MPISRNVGMQLGIAYSTAKSRLYKQTTFWLAQQAGLTTCYRCGKPITSLSEFTLEHKKSWLNTINAAALFFDQSNIAFSHQKCNSSSGAIQQTAQSSTGFKGVYYDHNTNRKKRYRAMISINSKNRSLGRYTTAEEAAAAYDKAAIESYGDLAITNASLGLIGSE